MKPKVLVLGSYHLDEVNSIGVDSEDGKTLLPNREKELVELLHKVKAFEPTKVVVEVEVKRQEEIDMSYETYLRGNLTLPHVFAVDWMGSLPEQKSLGDILD
ncbi:hypothetical protein ACTHQ4_16630 [Alkalicoccobacillus gibsonii]|uniref:hypothetical protein n=1 Tax=Alkalicoccobacillus gibsonii TaxID=79881 RepID=UPI003F7CB475